jgi:hypothetical protein
LVVAEDSWASSEFGVTELFVHFDESSVCDDESGVDETVEMSCCCFDFSSKFFVEFVFETVGHEFEGGAVVRDFVVETCEVEAVHDVFFVDFAKEFMALYGKEPFHPVTGGFS